MAVYSESSVKRNLLSIPADKHFSKFDAVIETGDKKDIGCEKKKRDCSGTILL